MSFLSRFDFLWLARLTTLVHPSMDDIVSGWQLHTIIIISWIPNSLLHYEVSQLQDKIINNCMYNNSHRNF